MSACMHAHRSAVTVAQWAHDAISHHGPARTRNPDASLSALNPSDTARDNAADAPRGNAGHADCAGNAHPRRAAIAHVPHANTTERSNAGPDHSASKAAPADHSEHTERADPRAPCTIPAMNAGRPGPGRGYCNRNRAHAWICAQPRVRPASPIVRGCVAFTAERRSNPITRARSSAPQVKIPGSPIPNTVNR